MVSSFLPDVGYLYARHDGTLGMLDIWLRDLLTIPSGYLQYDYETRKSVKTSIGRCKRSGVRVLLSKEAFNRYQKGKTAQKIGRYMKNVEWQGNEWVLVSAGICGPERFPFRDYASVELPQQMTETIAECYLDLSEEDCNCGQIANEWLKTFSGPLIPFELAGRKRLLKPAYEVLTPYFSNQL